MTGVVAAGAIAAILTSGSPGGGVTYTVVMPALGPYKWAPGLEKNAGLPALAASVAEMGGGQMSDSRARIYEKPAPGGAAPQLPRVIGGP